MEKALRVRSKFHQVPCETVKVSEAASKKLVSQTALEQPARNPKDKTPKAPQMSPVSRKLVASKKPTAYMLKAPYRTDTTVKRPPVKIPAGRSSRTSKIAGKKLSSAGVAFPKLKPCTKTAKESHGKVHVAAEPGLQLGSPKGPCCTMTPPSFAGGGDFAETGLQEPEVDPDPKALGEPCPLRTDPARKGTEPPVSTLQRNGSSLKLPLPYQKAFSKYVRLLEKCQDLKTDPEAAVPKRQFLERLQATVSFSFTPAEVKQELVHLRELHLLITQHMEAESPEALGENPTWDREYESLVTLQALQEVVEQHLSKLDQMREGESFPLEGTAMETELLPLLEPGRLPEGSRPSVIRAMYSLLCEGGEHVPVLVKDEEMSS
ncbi:hypothetical protein Chor_015158 [Crotalus horridus]